MNTQTLSELDFWSLPDISKRDIRVVVGLDFGTTFSGFAYANKASPDYIETQDTWPEQRGALKTNTVLQYDDDGKVTKWGAPALASRPKIKKKASNSNVRPVELFKLHLGNLSQEQRPALPPGLDHKKAITDYLREMNTLIEATTGTRWPGLEYHRHVLKVLTVPAEFNERDRQTMRNCANAAGLIDTVNSEMLQFTTEPEAAAIYCMKVLKEHNLNPGASYMIVDCGGGTVDLTTRMLLTGNKLSEITERSGDFCGSAFVDNEFVEHLANKLGREAIDKLRTSHYCQLQYMLQQFCQRVKIEFTGDPAQFSTKEIDLEEVCPMLTQFVEGPVKKEMEECEWLIELDYETIKGFFDRVLDKIITLVHKQLDEASNPCSAMFLVGGFSESQYLLKRIREEFAHRVPTIAVPSEPIAAVSRGAVYYGLNMESVQTRVLKRTYGIEISPEWKPEYPPHRRTNRGRINLFKTLAQRGIEVPVDAIFGYELVPSYPKQTQMKIDIYTTTDDSALYCDEPGMSLFGRLTIELTDTNLGLARPIEFTLTFGKMEIKAQAKNKLTGKMYATKFDLEF